MGTSNSIMIFTLFNLMITILIRKVMGGHRPRYLGPRPPSFLASYATDYNYYVEGEAVLSFCLSGYNMYLTTFTNAAANLDYICKRLRIVYTE